MKDLQVVNFYFLKYKWHLLGGILFVTISNIFGVLYPPVFRYSIDLITDSLLVYNLFDHLSIQKRVYALFTDYLMVFGALVLGLAVLKGIFMYFMRQTIIVMSRWIEFDQKNALFQKYLDLDLGFYRRNSTGDLMSRMTEDTGKVRMYTGPSLMYGINMVVMFVLVIGAMLAVNVSLTFWVLLPLPFLSYIIYKINGIILKRSKEIQIKLSRLTTFTQEAFSGIRVIKSYGREQKFKALFNLELEDFKAKSLNLVKVDAVFMPIMTAMVGLSTILTVFVGAIQINKGEITTGNIAEFVIYINMLTWPVASLGWLVTMVQQAAASQQRISEFMNLTPAIDKHKGLQTAIKGNIHFDNVSFTYQDSGIEALKNINFDLKAGQTLGIIGKTGSGKSTLAYVLSRLYDVKSGQIYIDDTNVQHFNPAYLRSQMGYVPQESFLFSDSIANNVGFGLTQADRPKIEQAIDKAAMTDTVDGLPQGLETLLGERGVNLSGGQKQRIAIARAIVRAPKIYIFDDCLSALDTNTEKQILENIQQLTQETTSVIISHRISSVINADKIIVLEQGQIVEQGSHQQLIDLQGYYHNIYQKQQIENANTAVGELGS